MTSCTWNVCFHLLYGKDRETGLTERKVPCLLLQGHSAEQMAKPKPKSDIKFVLNELLTLNMLDNSEKLLNFASITVTLLIVVLLLFSDYKDTTFY